jgi:signal transduction histidine kinase
VLEALELQGQTIAAMARLLNSLLDISKLESGAIRPEITDFRVAALFDELRLEFASLADSKGIELRVEDCAGCVRSDPSLVGQILNNLVATP